MTFTHAIYPLDNPTTCTRQIVPLHIVMTFYVDIEVVYMVMILCRDILSRYKGDI